MFFFNRIYWGDRSTKPQRFQVYNTIKQQLHTALCPRHQKSSLFPLPFIPPLPTFKSPHPHFLLAITTLFLSMSMCHICIKVCLKKVPPSSIQQEQFTPHWCNLAAKESGLECACVNDDNFTVLVSGDGRCCWVSTCTVWPSHSKWLSE